MKIKIHFPLIEWFLRKRRSKKRIKNLMGWLNKTEK